MGFSWEMLGVIIPLHLSLAAFFLILVVADSNSKSRASGSADRYTDSSQDSTPSVALANVHIDGPTDYGQAAINPNRLS